MKFTESEDIEAIHAPFQTLNANAVTERWVRTIREECLDKMIILNEQHLRQLLTGYLDYYNERRPHQGLEQDSPLGLNPVSKKAQFAIIRCWVASFEPTIAKLLDWHFHTRIGFLGYGAPEIFEQTDYNAGKLQSNTRRYRMKLCLEN
jgi:hypothetical protein